jgi:hypothetical protein
MPENLKSGFPCVSYILSTILETDRQTPCKLLWVSESRVLRRISVPKGEEGECILMSFTVCTRLLPMFRRKAVPPSSG